MQNALLGINAHINFDLPRAIAENLDPAELPDFKVMQKRKFDHDQVNDLLVRTVNPVQKVLAKNYEPGIAVVDFAMGRLDERACAWLLRTYRQQVWWNALAFAAAPEGEEPADRPPEAGTGVQPARGEGLDARRCGEPSWPSTRRAPARWPAAGRRVPLEERCCARPPPEPGRGSVRRNRVLRQAPM